MKQKKSLCASIVLDAFLTIASVALFGYMIHQDVFSFLLAGPLMFAAGDRAADLARNIRKLDEK